MTEIEMYKEKAFLVAETTLQNYLAGVGEYGNDIEAAIYIWMQVLILKIILIWTAVK